MRWGERKPLIGLMPLVDEERESYWMLPGYMKGIEQAGAIPLMLPLTEDAHIIRQLVEQMDGFLFTGGHDVSPQLYQQERKKECGKSCDMRDAMEIALYHRAYEQDKSILGICRGIQIINVAMGGSLYQDLETEYHTQTEHHQSPPYDKPVHTVTLVADSPLHRLLKKDQLAVNSYHHQALHRLAEGLSPMAVSEDGLTEAVYVPEKTFIWAFQWHPEFSYQVNEDSKAIFKAFVESCL